MSILLLVDSEYASDSLTVNNALLKDAVVLGRSRIAVSVLKQVMIKLGKIHEKVSSYNACRKGRPSAVARRFGREASAVLGRRRGF